MVLPSLLVCDCSYVGVCCKQAKSLGNEIGKNVPNAGDAKRAVDKNTPNLPNLGGGLPGSGVGKSIPRNS